MVNRVDVNQKEIVFAIRKMGMSVLILSDVGKGCPDLCLGFNGRTYLAEIKDGNKPPSKRVLTPAEKAFFESWKGHVCVIESVDEAIEFAREVIGSAYNERELRAL